MSAPTAAQKRRFSFIAEYGCIACRQDGFFGTPGEIHHCKRHGKRDHNRVAMLCPVHHKMTTAMPGILNRHRDRTEFAARYGDDDELHRMTCALLGETCAT